MIAKLNEQGCHVEGVFTHFATADEADLDKFEQQFSFFSELVDNLAYKPDLVHASNSATSIWHSETIFNAVRLGIVIYGLNSSGRELELPFPLKPALSLESSLVHVKKLEAGVDIGYRATTPHLGRSTLEQCLLSMRTVGPSICLKNILWVSR